MTPTRLRNERGSVLVSGLLLSLALLMVIGAGVDLAHSFIVRRELASIADHAALTGAQQLDLNAVHEGRLALDPERAREAALAVLGTARVTAADAAATTGGVAVRVERSFDTVLLRLVGVTTVNVTATANASPQTP